MRNSLFVWSAFSAFYTEYINNSNEKKTLNESRARDANLREKLSISTSKLLPENEEDRKVASMLTRYKNAKSQDDELAAARERIDSRRIFQRHDASETPSTSSGSSGATATPSERLKATMKAERDKRINSSFSSASSALGIKRKSELGIVIKPKKPVVANDVEKRTSTEVVAPPKIASAVSLIAQQYGDSSDSD
uniref:Uncharacterized protein n=1 Tax=Caenorhabditis japonica TaxID=281687 RepID=A0A8R1DV46_CAEJA